MIPTIKRFVNHCRTGLGKGDVKSGAFECSVKNDNFKFNGGGDGGDNDDGEVLKMGQ